MTRDQWIWATLAVVLGTVLARSLVKTPTRPSTAVNKPGIVNDLSTLLPPFRAKIAVLLARMSARGFSPRVWETGRSAERASALAESGKGIVKTMHGLGMGVDIVDAVKLWGATVEFKLALRDEAERLGLTSGARFDPPDYWHVQAIPLSKQAQARSLTTDAARIAFLTKFYA